MLLGITADLRQTLPFGVEIQVPIYSRKADLNAEFAACPKSAKTDIARAANVKLFDHRVGTGKKRRWNFDTKCFGSFEIDVNLVPIWLFDRKVGRLIPSNNLININSTLPCNRKEIRPQAD